MSPVPNEEEEKEQSTIARNVIVVCVLCHASSCGIKTQL
jgi:hypothetical protein